MNLDDRAPPAPVDFSQVRRVHLMGICGSAMGTLALMLAERGYEVRGSDASPYPPMSDLLEAKGITVWRGYLTEHLDWAPDLVVVGNVIRPDYPQAIAMRERGLPHASLPETLAGLFLVGKTPVVVSGTHGKTTTASMTAWLLEVAQLQPSFFIGGVTGNFGSSYQLGEGQFFVIEGDEYDSAYWDKGSKFLHYQPYLAAINNLEMDHADIFADIEAVEQTFTAFARLVPAAPSEHTLSPRLVVASNETRARRAASASTAPLWLTSLDDSGDIRAEHLSLHPHGSEFTLVTPAGEVALTLPIPGVHNVRNALVAAALALSAGASLEAIKKGLETFKLPFKRLTLRGESAGVLVFEDFAHHPTAIASTLAALRQSHPERRILALFEAQSNTARRRVFQEGFAKALAHADLVWLCRPLDKASDPLPPDLRLNPQQLIADISAQGVPAALEPELPALVSAVLEQAQSGDLIVLLSGRTFGGIYADLLKGLSER